MSHLKDLENITRSEKESLKDLLLNRIKELEFKKDEYESGLDSESYKIKAKVIEINKLIKFNAYLYHWICDPPSQRLQ